VTEPPLSVADFPAPEPLPQAHVFLGDVDVRVELARTPGEIRRGLMWRRYLPRNAGMLFLFEEPERQVFWMRNTYVALDMIFIGADLMVVGIVENAAPLSDEDRAVETPSQYVLEVRAGFAREHGISIGAPVRFELPEER
jgi:uncharacterized membrane protein (UPF0127 family)